MQVLNPRQPATPVAVQHAAPQLSMYKEPPVAEISLEDFERFALDRLKVLKSIEEAKLRNKSDISIQGDVKLWLQKYMKEPSPAATLHKDRISHFILRLAYCRSADLRQWLVAQEALLFKCRFKEMAPDEQVEFFRSMGLMYEQISGQEFHEVRAQLAQVALACRDKEGSAAISRADKGPEARNMPEFFKVPFGAVPDLLGRRAVLLREGYAYVGRDQVYSLVVGQFRMGLAAGLVVMAKQWGGFMAAEGQRLAPLVETMPSRSVLGSKGSRVPQGEISAGEVPHLVTQRHFPLCMTLMYERLAAEQHLKNNGRFEFGLFLKAIGLPMEQALLFFKSHFAPRTSGDKFDKEYAYNIRYNYGKEGAHKDLSEASCVYIINQRPGPTTCRAGECDGGCPYQTLDEPQLRAALSKLQCNDRYINEAVDKARGGHYQLACSLAFEGITGTPHDTGINKPSDYYAASLELSKPREGGGGKAEQQATPGAGGTGGAGAAGGGSSIPVAAAAAAAGGGVL